MGQWHQPGLSTHVKQLFVDVLAGKITRNIVGSQCVPKPGRAADPDLARTVAVEVELAVWTLDLNVKEQSRRLRCAL